MNDYTQEALKELARRELAKRQAEQQGFSLGGLANYANEHVNKPIESIGRSVRDVIGGYGQGLANIAPGLYNLGASGVNALGGNIAKSPMLDFAPHNTSTKAGELASFFSGPSFLKILGKIPELSGAATHAMKIPMIAEGIHHASNLLSKAPLASKVAGNALLGGAYAPDNPLIGIGLGAAGGLAGEGIGKVYQDIRNSPNVRSGINKTYNETKNALGESDLWKKINEQFNATAHAKELENKLSHGTNNITNNSRQLANDIRNAHNMREAESSIFYKHALKNAGHEPIYGVGHRDIFPTKVPEYPRQQETLNKLNKLNLGDTFDAFKSNPNFENAHRLQSELGSMERRLKDSKMKINDPQNYRIELNKINSAKMSVKNDISTFLEKRDLTSNHPVGSHYRKGAELFEENVAPFHSNKKLTDIVKEGKTDIQDLHSIFNTPTNKINKEGVEKIGSINKIMHDLPESSKERIIFSAIGGNKLTPKALIQKLDEIKSKGYESYFTPEINESINSLSKKLKSQKILKIGTAAAGLYGSDKIIKGVINHLF